MKRELEEDCRQQQQQQQQINSISCTVCDACGGSGRIPVVDVADTIVEPFDFASLPPELQLLIITACGHDLFALACASTEMNTLITSPQNHVFEKTTAFRQFHHLDYHAPNKKQMVSAQRLKLLRPTCLKLYWLTWDLDCATLLSLQSSLTALEMHDCDWKKAGQLVEYVLPQLTQLKHLVIYDCVFECEYPDDQRPPHFTIADRIGQLTGLQTLQLISEVTFDNDACLKNLTDLRWLDMQTYYQTPMLASLTHLVNLEILVMDGREMANRDADGWTCLSRLRKLYLLNSYDDNDQLEVYDRSFLPADFCQKVKFIECGTGSDPLGRHTHAIKAGEEEAKEEDSDGDGRNDLGEYYWDSSHDSVTSSDHSTDCECTDCESSGDGESSTSDSHSDGSVDDSDDDDGDMISDELSELNDDMRSNDSGEDTPTCQCSDCIDGSSDEFV